MAVVRGKLIGHTGAWYLVYVCRHEGIDYGRVYDLPTGTLHPLTPLTSIYSHMERWEPIEGWLRDDEIDPILDAIARPRRLHTYERVPWPIPPDDVVHTPPPAEKDRLLTR